VRDAAWDQTRNGTELASSGPWRRGHTRVRLHGGKRVRCPSAERSPASRGSLWVWGLAYPDGAVGLPVPGGLASARWIQPTNGRHEPDKAPNRQGERSCGCGGGTDSGRGWRRLPTCRRVSDVDACLTKENCSRGLYVSAWDRNHALIISFVT